MDVGTAASSLKERGICLSRVDRGGEKMESPPRLGLGIINIAPLLGRTDLTTRVWVWNLGTDLGMCQALRTAQHMGWLPFTVSYILISSKAHSIFHFILTHTHQHSSRNQYGISSQNPNIHLSCSHIISSKAANKFMAKSKNYWKVSRISRTQTYPFKLSYHIHQT